MNPHPSDHDELLARLLAGDVPAEDAAVRERLAACTQCRAELAAVRALEAELRASLGGSAAAFADARAASAPTDLALVRRTLEQVLSERRERAPRPRRWLPVLLAAALLAALALAVRFLGGPAPEPVGEILLSDGLVLDAPLGIAGGYPEFRWHLAPTDSGPATLPAEGHYELTISPYGPEGVGDPILDKLPLTEPRWTPTPEQLASLPQRIHWRVVALDGLGVPFASASASASR